jgi:tetratricopeptide (TPR) repeat protein
VLFQVVNTFANAGRWNEALPLALRAVEINPNLVDARQSLATVLTHFERYEEALVHLAEGDRLSPRAFQQVLALGHRCWALYGLGRLEESLAVVSEYVSREPDGRFPLMTRAMLLQQLGRTGEAQATIRTMRKAIPDAPLRYWIGLMRTSYLPLAVIESFKQHFAAAWDAVPEDAANQGSDGPI